MNLQLTDEKGYVAHRRVIDELALQFAASTGFVRAAELAPELFKLGIGDAKSGERLELAYSSTGAITRAAINSLVGRGLLAHYTQPTGCKVVVQGREMDGIIWTQILTPEGHAHLQSITEQKGTTV